MALAMEIWISAQITTYGLNDKAKIRVTCFVCGCTLVPQDAPWCPACGVNFDDDTAPEVDGIPDVSASETAGVEKAN